MSTEFSSACAGDDQEGREGTTAAGQGEFQGSGSYGGANFQ